MQRYIKKIKKTNISRFFFEILAFFINLEELHLILLGLDIHFWFHEELDVNL
jgi:hypothetical protein